MPHYGNKINEIREWRHKCLTTECDRPFLQFL